MMFACCERLRAEIDSRDTRTSEDGRFTVVVPEKYLPDPLPGRKLDVRVTIKHPRYVTYFDTADAREIATKGISARRL